MQFHTYTLSGFRVRITSDDTRHFWRVEKEERLLGHGRADTKAQAEEDTQHFVNEYLRRTTRTNEILQDGFRKML